MYLYLFPYVLFKYFSVCLSLFLSLPPYLTLSFYFFFRYVLAFLCEIMSVSWFVGVSLHNQSSQQSDIDMNVLVVLHTHYKVVSNGTSVRP